MSPQEIATYFLLAEFLVCSVVAIRLWRSSMFFHRQAQRIREDPFGWLKDNSPNYIDSREDQERNQYGKSLACFRNGSRAAFWIDFHVLPIYWSRKRKYSGRIYLAIWHADNRPECYSSLRRYWSGIRITLRRCGTPVWVLKAGIANDKTANQPC